jgi:molecular chaperone DnaK (HSP70)
MQIGGEDIENLIMNMVLEKLLKKNTNMRKHLSMPLC